MSTQLIERQTITTLVAQRDSALADFYQAIDLRERARKTLGDTARMGGSNPDAKEKTRKELDTQMWRHVINLLNIKSLMTAKQSGVLEKQISDDPMEFTQENVSSTLLYLTAESGNIFAQSIIDLYSARNFSFKTNTVNRFSAKLIFEYAYKHNANHLTWTRRDMLYDLDKVVHLIDGKAPPQWHSGGLYGALNAKRRSTEYAWAVETEYFKVRKYKKGTLHVTIKSADILEQMNAILANHFEKGIGGQRTTDHRA